MTAGTLSLVVLIRSGGASTVFLRLAIVGGWTDESRFYRALFQTVFVPGTVVVVFWSRQFVPPLEIGMAFAALNGALGGIAFIRFSKGLETVDASVGKPALVLGTVVTVALGILVLRERVREEAVGGPARGRRGVSPR